MKLSLCIPFACLLSTSMTGVTSADPAEMPTKEIVLGPQLSAELKDGTHAVIGAQARFAVAMIAPNVRVDIMPEFNYYFFDHDIHGFDLSGSAVFAFGVHSDVAEPYALAGLGIFSVSCDGCDSETRIGFNIGGGVKFLPLGKVQPFVQMRFTIGDIDPINLTGGVLFLLQ